MNRRAISLLLVLLTILAACGDDDDDGGASEDTAESAAASDGDCHVTIDDASRAVGLKLVESGSTIESDGGASCSWEYAYEGATATVDVTYFDGNGADAWEDAGAAYSDADAVTVEGADEAISSPSNSVVVARAGDDAVRVFVQGPDIILDDPMGAAAVLAEVALGSGAAGE